MWEQGPGSERSSKAELAPDDQRSSHRQREHRPQASGNNQKAVGNQQRCQLAIALSVVVFWCSYLSGVVTVSDMRAANLLRR
jgi:hypothetical protein